MSEKKNEKSKLFNFDEAINNIELQQTGMIRDRIRFEIIRISLERSYSKHEITFDEYFDFKRRLIECEVKELERKYSVKCCVSISQLTDVESTLLEQSMEKTYDIDIWHSRPGDVIRHKLIDYTIIRFVENNDQFFVLTYNHNTNSFELISEYDCNFKFRILYSISEDEKVKTLFTPAINEVFEILFRRFKHIIKFSNSDSETFCKAFESELKKRNISLKEQLKELIKKYQK